MTTSLKKFVGFGSVRFGSTPKPIIPLLSQEYSKRVDTSDVKCVHPFLSMVDILSACFDELMEFNQKYRFEIDLSSFYGSDKYPSKVRLWVRMDQNPVIFQGKLLLKLCVAASPADVSPSMRELHQHQTGGASETVLYADMPPTFLNVDVPLRIFQRLALKTNDSMIAKISSTNATSLLKSPLNLIQKKKSASADASLSITDPQEQEQTFEMKPRIQFSPQFDHELSFSDVKEEDSFLGYLVYLMNSFGAKREEVPTHETEQVSLSKSLILSDLTNKKESALRLIKEHPYLSFLDSESHHQTQTSEMTEMRTKSSSSPSCESPSPQLSFQWNKFFKMVKQSLHMLNPLNYLAITNQHYKDNYRSDVSRLAASTSGWNDWPRLRQIEELAFLNLESSFRCEITTKPTAQSPNSGYHVLPIVYQRLDQKTLEYQLRLSKGRRVRIHAWLPFYALDRPTHKYTVDQEGFKIDADDIQMKKEENVFLDERMILMMEKDHTWIKCGVHKPLNVMFWFELKEINQQVCLWKHDICLSKEEFDFNPVFWTELRKRIHQTFVELKKNELLSHFICFQGIEN